jgi:hypothetical protein
MEDLAAEIEYLLIKGVKYAQTECSKCNKGIPNQMMNRCLPCLENTYLDDLA